ncbi:hypothetical protein DEIPH_ctg052orf0055 [Deinococcus phoenicis]|uniref:Resolvase/invertase-type recombinase catalytic domain-containing protein n=1 Tax=Deinococcus phoenicis TaxID=1476583 RepID=A0A016QMI4_9DEIO|nr:recombinase family protein [Deinococcus phoenicis]EYB67057.1 hypothetical protein DEIPH_ctg052orf0055 [Deinococcus phoenicis]
MTPRAFSYARVSGRDQADSGYSLPAQRERAAAFAQFHALPVPIHFEDPAVSGKRDARPAWVAMMGQVRAGDTVLAKDLTRIARGGIVQTLTLIRDIEARGARLVLIDQSLDTSTPFGRVVLSILATLAEYELEQTRERSMIGRTFAAKAGIWPQGSVPYGYLRNAEKRLELNPATREPVRAALLALVGRSYQEASEELRGQGIPSPTGKPNWSPARLHALAQQTAYIGRAVFVSGGERIEVPCPRLLSDEEWEALHAGRRAFSGGERRPDRYPLVGHLRCPHGAPMNGRQESHRNAGMVSRYHVSGRLKRHYGCGCPSFRAAQVDDAARDLLARVLTDPTDPAHLALLTGATPLSDGREQERQEVQESLSNLARLRVLGQIEERDYLSLREELKARERALTPKPRQVTEVPVMNELAADVREASSEHLAELLDLLDVRLLIQPDGTLELLGLRPLDTVQQAV